MFSDELEKYSWEDITACIASKRNRDVEIALGKEHLQLDDFMALVSPAAAPYIEHMAALSRLYTQERNRRKSTRCRSRLFGTSSTNRTSLLLEPIDRSHAPQKRRLLSLDPIGSQRRGMLSRNLS